MWLCVIAVFVSVVESYTVQPYTTIDSAAGCVGSGLCAAGSVFASYHERILFVLTNAVSSNEFTKDRLID